VRTLGTVLAVLCVLAAGCASGGGQFSFVAPGGQTSIAYPAGQRQRLPNLAGERLAGESLTEPGRQLHVADFTGQVLVLNIWGSWCGPCRTEAPELAEVARRTGPAGVRLLGIDVQDQRGAAVDFLRDNHLGYPSIFDPAARTLLLLNNYPRNVLPSTIVLDRQQGVAHVFLGPVRAADLLAVVDQLSRPGGG
jgi:thiol-disulfide isomerase/thioredoxin